MNTEVELEIRAILKVEPNIEEAVKEIVGRVHDRHYSSADKLAIINFAFNCGCYKQVFNTLEEWLKRHSKWPWALFVEVLARSHIKPSTILLNYIFEGAETQGMLSHLILSHSWNDSDKRFEQFREDFLEQRNKRLIRIRENLKDKLNFLRLQRMIDEEQKVLRKLGRLFPEDSEIQMQSRSFEERWARSVLTAAANKTYDLDQNEEFIEQVPEEEKKVVKNIVSYINNIIKPKGEKTYNLAVMFYMMGKFNEALEVFKNRDENLACDWLNIELLYRSGRYIDSLQEIDYAERKYAEVPDAIFASNYYRALNYWQLGQKTLAVDLIKSIVKVRSDYRSAKILLSEWMGGVN